MNTSKSSDKSSKRKQMQARQRRQKRVTRLIWSGLGIAALVWSVFCLAGGTSCCGGNSVHSSQL
jgi:hypothetical protein